MTRRRGFASRKHWLATLTLGALVVLAAADGPPVEIWTHTHGVSAGNAIGRDVAIDSNGNVLTTGYVAETLVGSASVGTNGFLQKRRYDGVVDWAVTVDNPNTDGVASISLDDLQGVCVDKNDNVIAVGAWSGDWGTPSIGYWSTVLVQKYTPAGNLDWEWIGGKQYGPWSGMQGVTTDANGSIFAVGKTVAYATSGSDWGIWKFSPDGDLQPGYPKSVSFSVGQYLNDIPYDVAVHTDGSFVVAGVIGVSNGPDSSRRDYDWHVRRYDSEGTLAWDDTWPGASNLYDYAFGVTLDDAGNAYVAGYTNHGTSNNFADYEYDGLLIKYSPSGTRLWSTGSTGGPGASVLYTDVVLDGGGALTVVGYGRAAGSDEYIGISEGRAPDDGHLLGDDTQSTAGSDVLSMGVDARGRLLAGTGYFGTSGAYEIFTSLAEFPNRDPIIDESPQADTDLAAMSEEVEFLIAAHDPDGDPITASWDFGDGSFGSGLNPTHAFTTPGEHMVYVTVSDGIEDVQSQVGLDVGEPLVAPKIKAKLNFKKPGKDSLLMKCSLDLPDAFAPEGEVIKVFAGGVEEAFTLNKKGKGKSDAGKVALKFKKKKGLWLLAVTLKKGDFREDWEDEGLIDATMKKIPMTIKATVVVADTKCAHMVDVLYTARSGKWGKTK